MKIIWFSALMPPPNGVHVLLLLDKKHIVPAAYNLSFLQRGWWSTIDMIHYSTASCWSFYPELPKKGKFEIVKTDENCSF